MSVIAITPKNYTQKCHFYMKPQKLNSNPFFFAFTFSSNIILVTQLEKYYGMQYIALEVDFGKDINQL